MGHLPHLPTRHRRAGRRPVNLLSPADRGTIEAALDWPEPPGAWRPTLLTLEGRPSARSPSGPHRLIDAIDVLRLGCVS
jgi:hypothetical protein